MSTLKELLEGRELPVKVLCKDIDRKWFEVVHANKNYCLTTDSDGYDNGWLLSSENWELYTEPKKKVKVALYAIKRPGSDNWTLINNFFKNEHELLSCSGAFMSHIENIKRLDSTEIEVLDE